MSDRLPADLLLMESYARQIEVLCAAVGESRDGATAAEMAELRRLTDIAGALVQQIEELRRHYPLPAHVPAATLFA